MANHRDIIRAAGHAAIAEATGRPITTVRSWDQRESIPATEWTVFIVKGWATAEDLLLGKPRSKRERAA